MTNDKKQFVNMYYFTKIVCGSRAIHKLQLSTCLREEKKNGYILEF